ncbi:uncharacterized protein E0L32_002299 [Thyridium curvatum]|uniref:Uncharacterized protein n=1 Tax=Thyridium curvatum TaxID=1093900 RepID=A0A507AI75_9PEZI|nr:uncharacterized protein E0L32_002299 [Thyridium curvatum]TPX06803.1 hypothetical protein E0L32_002299 [Thyridium curvatum]
MKPAFFLGAALLQVSSTFAQWSAPSAAINWNGLGHIRVYAVDNSGQVREWQFDGSGWNGPSYIGATAMPGSGVTAVNDGAHLRVYYQDQNGRARERVYENGWTDGATLP